MKNIALFSVLVILSFSFVYADEISENKNRYAFSITPNTGFLWGQGEEIVYQGNPPVNNSKYYSQLLWDYKPLLYIGLDMEFGPRSPWAHNGFHASLGLKYGLPLGTGFIEDRDWLSSTGDYLTHYSRHDAFSRSSLNDLFEGYGSLIANLSFGYSWSFNNRLWLRAYGDFSYLRFSWKSRDGYTQYAPKNQEGTYSPWDPTLPKRNLSGPAIDYTQNWFILAPGISAGLKLNDYFAFSFFMAIIPPIYGACRDDHLSASKTVTYLDYLYGGLFFKAGSELVITFNDRISIILSFSIMDLGNARGDNYTSESNDHYSYHPNTAGGGFSFWDFSLGAKYTFRERISGETGNEK